MPDDGPATVWQLLVLTLFHSLRFYCSSWCTSRRLLFSHLSLSSAHDDDYTTRAFVSSCFPLFIIPSALFPFFFLIPSIFSSLMLLLQSLITGSGIHLTTHLICCCLLLAADAVAVSNHFPLFFYSWWTMAPSDRRSQFHAVNSLPSSPFTCNYFPRFSFYGENQGEKRSVSRCSSLIEYSSL